MCVGENPASCTRSVDFYNLLAERSIENDVLVVEGVVPHAVQPNDVVGGAIHSVDDVDDFKTHGLSTERIRLQDLQSGHRFCMVGLDSFPMFTNFIGRDFSSIGQTLNRDVNE